MELWTTIAGLTRRKRVIIPAVLVALSLGAMTYERTPVRYESTTTMVLTTTAHGGTESQDPARPAELINPMLNFNDSLRTTTAILIHAMNTSEVAKSLGALGPTSLTINDGRTNPNLLGLNGPFVYIAGESTSPEEARRIVLRAKQLMGEMLRTWQEDLDAPSSTHLVLADVVPPSPPVPDRGQGIRLGLAGALVGFLGSVVIAYTGSRIHSRLRARATARKTSLSAGGRPGRHQPRRGRRLSPSSPPALAADDDVPASAGVRTSLDIGSRSP